MAYLRQIEKTIRQPVPADHGHAYHAAEVADLHASSRQPPRKAAKPQPQGRPPQNRGQAGKPQSAKPLAAKPLAGKPQTAKPQTAKTDGGHQPLKASPAGRPNRHNRRPPPHGGGKRSAA